MSLNTEEELELQRHDLFFNAHLCHVCKTKDSFSCSKVCSGCKMISYCSIEHQKAHWKSHKSFCKAAQRICLDMNLDKCNLFAIPICLKTDVPKNEWCQKRWNLKTLFEKYLKRDLNLYEVSMLFFPKICKICHATNTSKELTCIKCFSASYCSEKHQKLDAHEKVCSDFQKALDMDLFMHNENLDSLQIELVKPNSKLDTCDMKSFITNNISPVLNFEMEALVSQYYSSVLTLIHIISQTPNFILGKRLTVHLVGASFDFEFQILQYWENLLHLLPELHSVTLIHIGPEVGNYPSVLRLCDTCWNANKSIQSHFYSQCYHEYYDGFCIVKPDVIIGLNCGLHENDKSDDDLWKPSLPFFLQHENVPIILTAYTELEAEKDLKRLLREDIRLDKKINVLKKCEKNPFQSLRPIKDWENLEDAVFYSNSYVSALIVARDI